MRTISTLNCRSKLRTYYRGSRWGKAVSYTPRPPFPSGRISTCHWVENTAGSIDSLDDAETISVVLPGSRTTIM